MSDGITPKISICSQVYNQSEWMREMVQSIVDQTFRNWELILVDDGSTEDLKAVLDSFNDKRIRYERRDVRRGQPFGVNEALKMARGKYICIMAADERLDVNAMKVRHQYLEQNPQIDAVWGMPAPGMKKDQYPLGPRPEWEQYALLAHNRTRELWLRCLLHLEMVPLGGGSMMMKKSVMDELGGMDESLTMFSDHELYCRFFEKYVGVVIPYRVCIDLPNHENSVRHQNHQKADQELAYVRAKHPLPVPEVSGKVTVGIPCYNHAEFLADAVNSALAQTHPVHEILILDDCSTDDFKTVASQFTDPRIKVMAFDENRGNVEAKNQMAFRAQGDFFVVLSADDSIEPTFVEKCLAEFKNNPWLEFVASQSEFYKADLKTLEDPAHPFRTIPTVVNKSREQWLAELRGGNQYFGAGMYRTPVISELGGWEKQYKVIDDYQMYLKLLQRENIGIVEEKLTRTRCHDKQYSKLDSKERQEELPWLYSAARAPFYRKEMKVIIATPFYELKGFSPYITSIMATARLLTMMGIDWRFMELSGDSYVHRARNTMCDTFLRDPDATDLFFIDSDMSWNPEAIVNMLMLPDDIIGGSYPVKNNWEAWTSIPHLESSEDGKHSMRGRMLPDGSALVEAKVLAGGFLRIKRGVLERFREHYPDLWYEEPTTDPNDPNRRFTAFFGAESIDHKFYGEDHCFARRLRDMGVKMFIYPNVNLVHWGYKPFEGNYHNWMKKSFQSESGEFGKTMAMGTDPGQRQVLQ